MYSERSVDQLTLGSKTGFISYNIDFKLPSVPFGVFITVKQVWNEGKKEFEYPDSYRKVLNFNGFDSHGFGICDGSGSYRGRTYFTAVAIGI